MSAGCRNCYAERMSSRLGHMARADVARGKDPGGKAIYLDVIQSGRWTGKAVFDATAVLEPLRWRKARSVFVCSMSDLFHEGVAFYEIARVFGVMSVCPQHCFQVLTKRPKRMAQVLSKLGEDKPRHAMNEWVNSVTEPPDNDYCASTPWPLPNVWVGTSVESADVVDRIDALRQCPVGSAGGAVRFLSLEPLLGPLPELNLAGIGWVIVGGESGPGARPIDPAWVRDLRDQCVELEVPFFFKQWGGPKKKHTGRELDGEVWDECPAWPKRGARAVAAEQEEVAA